MINVFDQASFAFFARYFLAGFVIFSVRSRFILGTPPKPAEIFAEALVLSLINQAVFLLGVAVARTAIPEHFSSLSLPDGNAVLLHPLFFVEVLALPVFLGLALGWNLHRGWQKALFRRLSLPIIHPVSRAHDFAFGNDRGPCFVIVSFNDGNVVYGYFGGKSLAASDDSRSDLFLERLYTLEDNNWVEAVPSRSALLSLENVRTVEFIEPKQE